MKSKLFRNILIGVCIGLLLGGGIVFGAKWSDYDELTSGDIVDGDDFLIRDLSATPPATGMQKRIKWSSVKSDLIAAGFTNVPNVDGYGGLEAAITAIGATEMTVVVTTAQTLTANRKFVKTLEVIVLQGGSIDGAFTLTINGPFKGSIGCFGGSITVEGLYYAEPEWWKENTTPGTTEMAAAINSAIEALLFGGVVSLLPTGYYLETDIDVLMGITLRGSGWGVNQSTEAITFAALAAEAAGTWFVISTNSVSISMAASGGQLKDFGMFWIHDAPGGGWTPTVYDWAIKILCPGVDPRGNDIKLSNIMLLNPYEGIYQENPATGESVGRTVLDGIFGQPFHQGIHFGFMGDVSRINNVHWWPYWSQHAVVKAYTLANTYGFYFERADNMQISNIFSIWHFYGMYFTSNAYGSVKKFHIVNADIDAFGATGIFIAGDDVTGQLINCTLQGETGETTYGIRVEGDDSRIKIGNLNITNIDTKAIWLNGTGNKMAVDGLWVGEWNIVTAAHEGIHVATGNSFWLGSGAWFDTGHGGVDIGGAGSITVDQNMKNFGSVNIASAAIITIPSDGDYFNIAGTTNITSITASYQGRRATLKFAQILTFTDGSNLKIAGDFVTSGEDTINIICDGTNWYEISRSVN